MLNTLPFIVTTDINVMVAECAGAAQVEDPMTSLGAEDNAIQTSVREPCAVEFVAVPVTVEATTTIVVPEVSVTTSASDELVVSLIPAQVESAPIFVGVTRPVIERGSGSAPTGSSPATDIMEELAHK